MQAHETSTSNTTLNAVALAKLQEILNEIDRSGDYLRLSDGQSENVIFDLVNVPGLKTRTIRVDDGTEKQLIKIVFIVKNERLQKNQLFELSRKWTKRAIACMTFNNTNALTVKRTGVGLKTDYSFQPAESTSQPIY
jgi:hypothetical protein